MGDSLVTLTSVSTAPAGERGVYGEHLTDGEDEVLAVDLAEAAAAEDDLVVAGLEEGSVVLAGGVGGDAAGDAGVSVGDDNGGVGNCGAGLVRHGAGDVTDGGGLCGSRKRHGDEKQSDYGKNE